MEDDDYVFQTFTRIKYLFVQILIVMQIFRSHTFLLDQLKEL